MPNFWIFQEKMKRALIPRKFFGPMKQFSSLTILRIVWASCTDWYKSLLRRNRSWTNAPASSFCRNFVGKRFRAVPFWEKPWTPTCTLRCSAVKSDALYKTAGSYFINDGASTAQSCAEFLGENAPKQRDHRMAVDEPRSYVLRFFLWSFLKNHLYEHRILPVAVLSSRIEEPFSYVAKSCASAHEMQSKKA